MAKLRSINTRFWRDDYIAELPPEEKLMFLYLLSCEDCNVAGVYELSRRQAVFDTMLPLEKIEAILQHFEADGKVVRVGKYVILVNFSKNQKLNPNMERSRLAIIKALPPDVLKAFESLPKRSEPFVQFNLIESNSIETKDEVEETLAARAQKFKLGVFAPENRVKFGVPMLQAFFDYWTEPNRSGKRMRFELQPTWKLAGRLATWQQRDFAKRQGGAPAKVITYQELLERVNKGETGVQDIYKPVKKNDKTYFVHRDHIDEFLAEP
jgi:hypothetical protein